MLGCYEWFDQKTVDRLRSRLGEIQAGHIDLRVPQRQKAIVDFKALR
jgi:hypothetical protein